MKRIVKVVASLVVVMVTQVHAVKMETDMDVVLEMGKQMSNARAMLENYVVIGAKIKFQDPVGRLKGNIESYESMLKLLDEKHGADARVQEAIKKSLLAWKPIRDKLLIAVKGSDRETLRKNAQFVHDNIRSIIIEMANMKKYFLKGIACTKSAELDGAIEIATSARRLSAYYMMQMWKLKDPTIVEHWNAGVDKYRKGIAVLKKSSFYSDAEFKDWLDKTEKILEYAIMSFTMTSASAPSIIHKKCEEAFELGNKMTQRIAETQK